MLEWHRYLDHIIFLFTLVGKSQMTAFSDVFEDALLNHIFHPDQYTYPRTNMIVALWIGNPTDTGLGGAEVSGGSYSRVITAPANWAWSVGGSVANLVRVAFLAATSNWGTVTHFALFNTLGDLMFHGPLKTPVAVKTGQITAFPPLKLVVALD